MGNYYNTGGCSRNSQYVFNREGLFIRRPIILLVFFIYILVSACAHNDPSPSVELPSAQPPDPLLQSAEPVPVMLMLGQTTEPEAFVAGIPSSGSITASFKRQPEYGLTGEQLIMIRLTDQGGNTADLNSTLLIVGAAPAVTVEALMPGDQSPELNAADFLEPAGAPVEAEFVEGFSREDFEKPGDIPVVISAGGVEFDTLLRVTDTTPPTADPLEVTVLQHDTVDADAFVTGIRDVSQVTVSFDVEPDFSVGGTREVTIVLEDACQNRTLLTATLTVELDPEPPVIEGAADMIVFVGDKVTYKQGVTATDNRDGDISVSVDSSAVNLNEEGRYPLIYRAVDSSGNETSETVIVTVAVLTDEALYDIADSILQKITTPEMSAYDKAYVIYKWVTSSISYTGSAEKDSVAKAAYRGFKSRQGDCYTFYSVSEILLVRAGMQSMRVDRVGGRVNHYWNLVNIGTGWYHFDTTPFVVPIETFLFTDAQAEEYTRLRTSVRNCYVYDKSLYPPVETADPKAAQPEENAP